MTYCQNRNKIKLKISELRLLSFIISNYDSNTSDDNRKQRILLELNNYINDTHELKEAKKVKIKLTYNDWSYIFGIFCHIDEEELFYKKYDLQEIYISIKTKLSNFFLKEWW